jgi:hypothetical protein
LLPECRLTTLGQVHFSTSGPLVYSWDGRRWRLDSGTFGGAIMSASTRTDVDNLLYATAVNDTLPLRASWRSRWPLPV